MENSQAAAGIQKTNRNNIRCVLFSDIKRNKIVYLMILPVLLNVLIFKYGPMYGIQIAFRNYTFGGGFFGSEWVGLLHFQKFFDSFYFWRLIRNTFAISFYNLVISFPSCIVFALLLNEIKREKFKRAIQTVSYLPHFISLVVICGIIRDFTMSDGLINDIISFLGFERTLFLQEPQYYRAIHIGSGIWQSLGWESIIYIAALSSIDQNLYEAAILDGANRLKQAWHVTLPGIKPTIIILLIFQVGNMLNVGSEKILLLYSPRIYETADVISTFIYREGLQKINYSYSAAVGLFNSVISFIFIFIANYLSKKHSETSLW